MEEVLSFMILLMVTITCGLYDSDNVIILQAPCQVELENWVNSIHSACAAAFARFQYGGDGDGDGDLCLGLDNYLNRHRGKTGTLHLLQVTCFLKTDWPFGHLASNIH